MARTALAISEAETARWSRRTRRLRCAPVASSTWEALDDLLQEPGVAIGVGERGERAVAGVAGVWPGHSSDGAAVVEDPAGVVEHVADVDALGEELGSG